MINHFKNLSNAGVTGANGMLIIINKQITNPSEFKVSNLTYGKGDINKSFNIVHIKTKKAVAYFSVDDNNVLYFGKCKKDLCHKCQKNLESITSINTCASSNTINITKALEVSKNISCIQEQFNFINSCNHI